MKLPIGHGRAGMTLVEILVAITVLTVAIAAMASTVVTTSALNQQGVETETARKAAATMLEALRNEPFATVFARYNASPADDPGGAGTAPGKNFAVAGLTSVSGAPGGMAGEILFPWTGPAVREDTVDATLGMPRDLSGDATVDAADHAGDYLQIPVRVRVRWTGSTGERSLELATLLSGL